jgi:hypothetical protein
MLTSSQAALLNNKIAGQLDEVGTACTPPSKANTGKEAWDYFIAAKIEAYGKAMKKKAVDKAVKAGVIFDHMKSPLAPGSDEVVYSGDVVQIRCTVKQPSTSTDSKKLIDMIIASGLINASILANMVAGAETKSRAAHTFTAELVTE